MEKPKLFILDLMALVFRCYHAFSYQSLTTSNGIPVSAIFASAKFLINLIKNHTPQYFAVAVDSKEPTFRHQMYPQYKANRVEMPEDLVSQMPYIFRLIEALKIKSIKIPGVEADDIIGSLVNKFYKEPLDIYIISGDKDFMQLLKDNVFMYVAKKNDTVEIITPQTIKEKFGCSPQNIIDLLAIIGDSSDNVPGVRGIGEKGAIKLISQFGSIENIYQNIDKVLNEKQKKSLLEYKELAELSKKLIIIKQDVPIDLSLEDIKFNPTLALANQDLLKLFEELEFKKLAADILKNIQNLTNENTLDNSETTLPSSIIINNKYHLINELTKFENFMSYIKQFNKFSFDTETTGLDIIIDKPIGLSFAVKDNEAFYIPLHSPHLENNLSVQIITEQIKHLYEDTNKLKIAHNAKFDIQMLWNIGCNVQEPIADTMIASYLLDPTNKTHNLDHCCLKYLNYTKIPTSSLIGEDAKINMQDVDITKLTQYACEDADLTLRLYKHLEVELLTQNLFTIFTDIEMPLVKVLADIEKTGVYINPEILKQLSQELEQKSNILEQQIYELAQETFNINSTKQLQNILFDKLKIHEKTNVKLKKTKTGYSTDVSVLEKLSSEPIVQKILEYRTLMKLKTTYVDTLPYLIHPQTKRLHTTFHQTGTATGRLSSSNPNLQNIPIRSDIGKQIRSAFCTQDKESYILSADYSQIELRILAHLSEDPNLLSAFEQDLDIHRATASKIFGVPPNDVTEDMRNKAKAINFGIIYGMGPARLARETGVSFNTAKEFIDKYFENFYLIKKFVEMSINSAKEKGYCETIFGRKRPLLEIFSTDPVVLANAEHIAVNSPIQGSAADLIKIAMIKIYKKFKQEKLKSKMILQIHDELVFECPYDELQKVQSIVKDIMQNAAQLKVKLVVDIGYGKSWLEAH